jgi:hypothetical protein
MRVRRMPESPPPALWQFKAKRKNRRIHANVRYRKRAGGGSGPRRQDLFCLEFMANFSLTLSAAVSNRHRNASPTIHKFTLKSTVSEEFREVYFDVYVLGIKRVYLELMIPGPVPLKEV